MRQTTGGLHRSRKDAKGHVNRRQQLRTRSHFPITVSYVDGHRFAIDHGHVTDLSENGIGLQGEEALKPGMEVALFIALPDSGDDLCIPEARVSWASGRRFGVTLRTLTREDHNRLQHFLARRHW